MPWAACSVLSLSTVTCAYRRGQPWGNQTCMRVASVSGFRLSRMGPVHMACPVFRTGEKPALTSAEQNLSKAAAS